MYGLTTIMTGRLSTTTMRRGGIYNIRFIQKNNDMGGYANDADSSTLSHYSQQRKEKRNRPQ